MHLGVRQQQGDWLVAHNRAGQLFHTVDLLKVDGHRKHQDAARVVDLLSARAGPEVLDVEEDVHVRADFAAALLDELAHVLAERPRMRQEEVEARRWLEPRQVRKLHFCHRRQLHEAPATMTEPAQFVLHADVVGDVECFEEQLGDKHGNSEQDEEEEEAFCRSAKAVAAAGI
eukprot:1925579-Prymnesium_polylepis.1